MRKLLLTIALTTLVGITSASAQTYPSKPITIIVPFAAGGGSDVIGRIVAERMRVSLGQPVIIENVVGAAGNMGVGRVARAVPDGYTLILGIWNTHVANGALYSLQYDLMKDFEPISLITDTPLLIVAKKAMPANDLKSLIAWLKTNPDKASAGTAGAGSAEHVTAVLFQNITGTRFQFVPYRGGGPAMQDLVGGQIDMMIAPSVPSLPQIRSGSIKAYAVTSETHLAAAPDIPTVDEAELPGFYFSVWTSLWAPKGTPTDVTAKLNAALVEALADPDVRTRVANQGPVIVPREQQTPEALGVLQRAEIEKWWPIMKAANMKGE
jgi:tripartite-type tricarboxylate transporter receptor subunit TctC